MPDVDGSSFLLFYRGLGEYYQKDFERAAKDFDHAYEVDPTLYAQIGKALSESIAHRRANGLEILQGLEGKIEHRGVGDPEATYKIAQAYSMLGDKVSGLRVLRSSVEGGFFSYPYLATDPLLEALRKEPEFAEILMRDISAIRHFGAGSSEANDSNRNSNYWSRLEIPKTPMGVSEVLVVIEHVDSIGAPAQHCHLILPDATGKSSTSALGSVPSSLAG